MDGGKKRKENFTDGEIRKLLEMFAENKDTLTSKFNNSNTNKRKMIKWREMTAAINECSSGGRTVKEVRKKWKDLLSRAKKDKTLLKKPPTGGGPLPKTSPYSDIIIDIFGEESLAFVGLNGVDSSASLPDERDEELEDECDVVTDTCGRPTVGHS